MTKNLPHRAKPESDLALPSPPPPPLVLTKSNTPDPHAPAPDSDIAPSAPPPSKSATSNPHAPLISLLTTFYTLLSDLRYYHPSKILHPPHPPDSINLEEAAEYNFTDPAALALLYHLPYLVFGDDRDLMYETAAQNYTSRYVNWDVARDPTYGYNMDMIPRQMVNLTAPRNSGWNILYDVRACTITAWNHFDDPTPEEETVDGEHDFAAALRACVPRGIGDTQNKLVQWVLKFLKLELVPRICFGAGNITDMMRYEDNRALKEVYLRAGWDPSVVEGIEAAAWMAQALGQDSDGAILVAKLEEARIRAKRNFDVETYTRLHEEWERKYDEYDQWEEEQQRQARVRAKRDLDVWTGTRYGEWRREYEEEEEERQRKRRKVMS